jgi:hypothetical protein
METEQIAKSNPETRPAPEGLYGVFCEPKGHMHDPRWTSSEPKPYEAAIAEADLMNRSNHAWHYYAKPIR